MVVVFGYGESWVGRAIMVVCHDAKVMVVCVPMGFLVSEGCLVDTNDTPAPIDAQMYRWNQVKENSSSASIDPILHFFMFCSSKLI